MDDEMRKYVRESVEEALRAIVAEKCEGVKEPLASELSLTKFLLDECSEAKESCEDAKRVIAHNYQEVFEVTKVLLGFADKQRQRFINGYVLDEAIDEDEDFTETEESEWRNEAGDIWDRRYPEVASNMRRFSGTIEELRSS